MTWAVISTTAAASLRPSKWAGKRVREPVQLTGEELAREVVEGTHGRDRPPTQWAPAASAAKRLITSAYSVIISSTTCRAGRTAVAWPTTWPMK